jgi:hypothetical protein
MLLFREMILNIFKINDYFAENLPGSMTVVGKTSKTISLSLKKNDGKLLEYNVCLRSNPCQQYQEVFEL